MRIFAQRGYDGARAEDMAAEMGIAKGSIFQHFKTKEGLFLAAYKKAVAVLGKYLDAPPAAQAAGFFGVIRYWLEATGSIIHSEWMPYRVLLIGVYGTQLSLRREIQTYMMTEDPQGTLAFVRWGIERGEVRDDVDARMIASLVEWTVDRFQDAVINDDLDPGLFRGDSGRAQQEAARIGQYVEILRGAIGKA